MFALCMGTAKALASLPVHTGCPEPSLRDNAISTKISCAGLLFCMSLNVTNPVFAVTDKVRFKPACSATETN